MTQYQPSPWKWNWRHDDGVTCCGSVFSETSKGNAYAVALCPRGQPEEQWDADASLISAAPELLEALQNVRSIIAEAALTGFNCNDGDWAERLFTSQQKSTAAILKATGGGQ